MLILRRLYQFSEAVLEGVELGSLVLFEASILKQADKQCVKLAHARFRVDHNVGKSRAKVWNRLAEHSHLGS